MAKIIENIDATGTYSVGLGNVKVDDDVCQELINAAKEFISKQEYESLQKDDRIFDAFVEGAKFISNRYKVKRGGLPTYNGTPPPPLKQNLNNSILREAINIVEGTRNDDYGDAVDTYNNIAAISSILCNKEITALTAVIL